MPMSINYVLTLMIMFLSLFLPLSLSLSAAAVFFSELVSFGVGYHHAGMSSNDRKSMETVFYNGELPVLCKCPVFDMIVYSTVQYQ